MKLASSLGVLFTLIVALPAAEPQRFSIEDLGEKIVLLGRLHVPLGEVVRVEGVVVSTPQFEDGPFFEVQRINGKYTQENLRIPIAPFFDAGDKARAVFGDPPEEYKMGQTYALMGYESGQYVGIPAEVKKMGDLGWISAPGHYFRAELKFVTKRAIEPIDFAPKMFSEGKALLQGVARTQGTRQVVVGKDWSVLVADGKPWPAEVEGKTVETFGAYKADAGGQSFDLVDGEWRLVRLEDQVGRKVTLRGTAWGTNDIWWLEYRGEAVFVEAMEKLPGWERENHGRPVIIEGLLERGDAANSPQVPRQVRDQQEYFVVRKASWKPLPALLAPEIKSLK